MRSIPRMTTSFQLRQYQRDAFTAIFESWNEHRSVLANLPTGLGKTALAAAVMQETVATGGRCVFIADTNELCEQPLRGIRKVTGEIAALEKAEDRARLSASYTVASLQTLARASRLERFPRDHFDVVVFDESHRQVEQHAKIATYFDQAKILGLTATAFRSDMADLSEYYDAVAYSMDIAQAIDLGLMPPIMIDTAPIKIDISSVRQSMTANGKDYNAEELGRAIRPYYERVAAYLKEHAAHRHIAAYLPLVACSKEFASVCCEAGIRAVHVDGESPDRKEILAAFERRDYQLISCSALLTTGWDVPHVDGIVNLRPTRSVGLFRQIVGRGTRVLPGVIEGIEDVDARKAAIAASAKKDLVLFDFVWSTGKLGICGPAAIVSDSPEEIASLNGRIAKGNVVENVRAEREEKLKRELDEAAKRDAQFIAIQAIAGLVDAPDLIDYQPLFAWEREAVTEKQGATLRKFGIDPEKVTSKGHASKILDILIRRSDRGFASIQTLAALRKRGLDARPGMTEADAMAAIGGDMPFPFGKWRGVPFNKVPDGYFHWFIQQDWANNWPIVLNYARRVTARR